MATNSTPYSKFGKQQYSVLDARGASMLESIFKWWSRNGGRADYTLHPAGVGDSQQRRVAVFILDEPLHSGVQIAKAKPTGWDTDEEIYVESEELNTDSFIGIYPSTEQAFYYPKGMVIRAAWGWGSPGWQVISSGLNYIGNHELSQTVDEEIVDEPIELFGVEQNIPLTAPYGSSPSGAKVGMSWNCIDEQWEITVERCN